MHTTASLDMAPMVMPPTQAHLLSRMHGVPRCTFLKKRKRCKPPSAPLALLHSSCPTSILAVPDPCAPAAAASSCWGGRSSGSASESSLCLPFRLAFFALTTMKLSRRAERSDAICGARVASVDGYRVASAMVQHAVWMMRNVLDLHMRDAAWTLHCPLAHI